MESILIKISGEVFSSSILNQVIVQIKELKKKYTIGIVVGAGNIFRGNQQGKQLGIQQATAHNAGMIATIINGLILQDLLEKESVKTKLLSAVHCPQVADLIQQNKIDTALKNNECVIFVGGTGNPFFTTDTAAVLRAMQIGATQIFKGTKVNGVYSNDPAVDKDAKFYQDLTYNQVLEKKLKVMDLTAITLAKQHGLKIRVFNLFKTDALINATKEADFGSSIS